MPVAWGALTAGEHLQFDQHKPRHPQQRQRRTPHGAAGDDGHVRNETDNIGELIGIPIEREVTVQTARRDCAADAMRATAGLASDHRMAAATVELAQLFGVHWVHHQRGLSTGALVQPVGRRDGRMTRRRRAASGGSVARRTPIPVCELILNVPCADAQRLRVYPYCPPTTTASRKFNPLGHATRIGPRYNREDCRPAADPSAGSWTTR